MEMNKSVKKYLSDIGSRGGKSKSEKKLKSSIKNILDYHDSRRQKKDKINLDNKPA